MNIGDVVNLRSGGAEMVIIGFRERSSHVLCSWHNNDREPEEEEYPSECLVLISAEGRGNVPP